VDSEPAQSAFGPEKWLIGLALFFLFGIGVLWAGSKALWYQVSIPAPNLEAAGRAVLVQFRQPTNGLIFVLEPPRSADPDTSTVAFKSTNGAIHYRIDIKRINARRWAMTQYDNLDLMNQPTVNPK
jgi:hypothetical protein